MHTSQSDASRNVSERGFALVISYVVLSAFLIYSQVLTMRTVNQRMVETRMQEQAQALDLAQGAAEQLREEFYHFVASSVYASIGLNGQPGCSNNAACAFLWLDNFGVVLSGQPLPVRQPGVPPFQPEFDFINAKTGAYSVPFGSPADGNRDGIASNPRCLTGPLLPPTIAQGLPCLPVTSAKPGALAGVSAPRAWLRRITCPTCLDANGDGMPDPGQLLPRYVTVDADAQVGSVKKQIQVVYAVNMAMANIWRYAQTTNNLLLERVSPGARTLISGEILSNGDMIFDQNGTLSDGGESVKTVVVNGDLYASMNSALTSPTGALQTGGIYGDPYEYGPPASNPQYQTLPGLGAWGRYWIGPMSVPGGKVNRPWKSRPTRLIVASGQPAINGRRDLLTDPLYGAGYGWDSETVGNDGQAGQEKYPSQLAQDLPYLGDLSLYTNMATQYNVGQGSTLTGGPGRGVSYVQKGIYAGQDGQIGTADDSQPLVLIGTPANPIVIDGPVVLPSDVIIRGLVKGRGTIYAGRNVHIIGDVTYCTTNKCASNGFSGSDWSAPLERSTNVSNPVVRMKGTTTGKGSNLGTVDSGGNFTPNPSCQ